MKGPMVRGLAAATLTLAMSANAAELENDAQKLGYMIGMDIGESLRQQGTHVDLNSLFEAIRTTYSGEEPAMTPEQAQAVREAFVQQRQAAMAAEKNALGAQNKAEADAFLAENAGKDGVVTTASGLQYKVIEPGEGARPGPTDSVTVHYRGTLLDGTEFDSSYSRNEPISFALDRVIPGWSEGVQLMPVGSKYEFYISPELGYGESGGGPIPPNSALIFEVELLSIDG
ncbi:FKBP-type peptidyl-prolyl cis-trans isomerase [Marinihelvus fidelis]|uniref:Peptidyl-prolyl cis-trans isomerase n=1 Tax=Marinihelvus fidelis TaxID=2613842 RepID=A0A5N0TE26_9GAMM|nr:FKBP-type peptidyl-prolyl cis-trans isomerase [Marinihelvus fidelis]KAA9133292.1 FKBP-type peptidyl-prolyl cis-trans isomerase [Marinihelvus fidelis]